MDKNDANILRDDYRFSNMFKENVVEKNYSILNGALEFIGQFDEYYNIDTYFENKGFNGRVFPYLIGKMQDDNAIIKEYNEDSVKILAKKNEQTKFTTLCYKAGSPYYRSEVGVADIVIDDNGNVNEVLAINDNHNIIYTTFNNLKNLNSLNYTNDYNKYIKKNLLTSTPQLISSIRQVHDNNLDGIRLLCVFLVIYLIIMTFSLVF